MTYNDTDTHRAPAHTKGNSMSLFSKTKPEEPTGLPEGYDDEASRYYVPADRREFYVATAKPAFSEVLDRADWLIRQEAAEQVDREDAERGESPVSNLTGRRRERDPREYAERRQSRTEQIKRARHEEFVALAGHSLRAGAAESAEALTGPDYNPDDWVSIADAAALYSVSEWSIRRWIQQRDVETRRLGTRATRVSVKSLERLTEPVALAVG